MFGQLARLSSGQVVNRQNITDQSGRLISTYDKVHTFSYAGETNYIAQGEQPCVSMIDGIPVGGSICYDLRFAELFHHYRERAAMVINTANWYCRQELPNGYVYCKLEQLRISILLLV